jgi:hypothetical protein
MKPFSLIPFLLLVLTVGLTPLHGVMPPSAQPPAQTMAEAVELAHKALETQLKKEDQESWLPIMQPVLAKYIIHWKDPILRHYADDDKFQDTWIVMFTNTRLFHEDYYICVPRDGEAFFLYKKMY